MDSDNNNFFKYTVQLFPWNLFYFIIYLVVVGHLIQQCLGSLSGSVLRSDPDAGVWIRVSCIQAINCLSTCINSGPSTSLFWEMMKLSFTESCFYFVLGDFFVLLLLYGLGSWGGRLGLFCFCFWRFGSHQQCSGSEIRNLLLVALRGPYGNPARPRARQTPYPL